MAILGEPASAVPAADSARTQPADPAWAWAPYQPGSADGWDLRRTGHLLRRAGFGGNWQQLQQVLAEGPQRSVDKLLHPDADVAGFNQAQDRREASTDAADSLRAWWLRRMLQTPHPLLEQMKLFWHSCFGISAARAGNPAMLGRHVQRLRAQALGKFDVLVSSLVDDPAFLLGLDAGANRKALPSEHAARVWLERYTVGPGEFTPQDTRELSRALTGWFVLRGEPRFLEREFDTGEKQLLGRRGKFAAQEAVRVLLEHPATARSVVRKLYRWLISEVDEPSPALLAPLAQAFAKDYDVARLVSTMLRSNQFFSAAAYRRRIKSPVDLAVGLIRGLDGVVETIRLGHDLADLGQNLYHPPTVDGWTGGTAWVNPALILGRHRLAAALLSETGVYGGKLDPAAVAERQGGRSPEALAQFISDLLLSGDLPDGARAAAFREVPQSATAARGETGRWLRQFTLRLSMLPEFQLA
jgi:uncharacterized protein (DUF1800 family)